VEAVSRDSRDAVQTGPSRTHTREAQNETDSLRCCSCGSEVPFRQGVFYGVCETCWNEAMGL
jgi:hypothetical protein